MLPEYVHFRIKVCSGLQVKCRLSGQLKMDSGLKL